MPKTRPLSAPFVLRVDGAKSNHPLLLPPAIDACYSETLEIKAPSQATALEILATKQAQDDRKARHVLESARANGATPEELSVLKHAIENAPRYADYIVNR